MLRDYSFQQGLRKVSLLITTNKHFNSGTFGGEGLEWGYVPRFI